jgi:hypothetical protein
MTTVFICTATRTSNIKDTPRRNKNFTILFIWNASLASLPHTSVDYSKYTNALLHAFLFVRACPTALPFLANLHHFLIYITSFQFIALWPVYFHSFITFFLMEISFFIYAHFSGA